MNCKTKAILKTSGIVFAVGSWLGAPAIGKHFGGYRGEDIGNYIVVMVPLVVFTLIAAAIGVYGMYLQFYEQCVKCKTPSQKSKVRRTKTQK